MGANPNLSDSSLITMNTSLIQVSTTSPSPLTTSYPPWIQMSTTTYDNYTHNMSDSMVGEVVSDTKWMKDVQYVLNYRVVVAIALLGIIGNILNMVVLTRRSMTINMSSRMEKSANVGLMALALSDFFFCLVLLPSAVQTQQSMFQAPLGFHAIYSTYKSAVVNIFIMSSTWLTVVMAISRYLAICHPLQARGLIGTRVTKSSICIVFIYCVLCNLPKFWLTRLLRVDCVGGYSIYFLAPGPLAINRVLYTAYTWTYAIMGIFLPLILLIVCNGSLIKALRRSAKMRLLHTRTRDRSKDSQSIVTRTLIVIVICYIILVVPAEMMVFFIDAFSHSSISPTYNLMIVIANTLQAVNFAFNFVLYCVMNVYFRRTMKQVVTCGKFDATSLKSEATTTYSNLATSTNAAYSMHGHGRSRYTTSRM